MHLVFQMEELEIHLKLEVIQLGIQLLQHLFMEQHLCIPTVFVAYTGEALDYKTPLLRALQAVDNAAVDVCKYFDKNVKKVNASLGWEQEYFLIDSALAMSRPDIILTGRTLLGHSPAKGQQLDDHYFGSIPDRAMALYA